MLDVDVGCGDNVKVSPSVVSVVGEVTLGRVRVFDPMMITPELEVNVWPSGRVVISSPGVVVLEVGDSVKVSPSVVSVVGDVTLGRVKVFDPTMITPELEVNVWPSGRVVISSPGVVVPEVGDSVKVSPSVVNVVGEVTLGRVKVFDPTMITPELEVNVCPSGRVVISSPGVVVPEVGDSVKVSPSVVSVVGDVTLGRVNVLLPIMTTPELEVSIWPFGRVVMSSPGTVELFSGTDDVVTIWPLDVKDANPVLCSDGEPVEGGTKVNVSPSVTSTVVSVTLGINTVSLPPMTNSDPLETIVCPSEAVHVVAPAVVPSFEVVSVLVLGLCDVVAVEHPPGVPQDGDSEAKPVELLHGLQRVNVVKSVLVQYSVMIICAVTVDAAPHIPETEVLPEGSCGAELNPRLSQPPMALHIVPAGQQPYIQQIVPEQSS